MSTLDRDLQHKREQVDRFLDETLQPRAGCPSTLLDAMRYSVLAPGKRLRPMLSLLACEACGGTAEQALAAAASVEMIHTYSLIHDDLPAMDDDDLRRGRPTCHKQFGEALAILAGDALLTMGFEVLTTGYPARVAAGCCQELARGAGAAGMVGGQVDDLAFEGRLTGGGSIPTLDELQLLHARKTGALFLSALRMGAWVALGEEQSCSLPATLSLLDEYGRRFGLAFQITDDLLDVEGAADLVGKRVQKDATRGKLTYPALLGVAESRARAERLCREACEWLAPLGPTAERLSQLARFVVERDR